MDYKDTLNLPNTSFPMKANLSQKEQDILKFWQEQDIHKKLQDKNKTNQHYILHDGPPYANGNIHIGHALNKILKDIIVKFKSMQGYYSPYIPGWDCHGLPIELQVDKNLGDKKNSISISEKRQLCRQYADEFVNIQREEFKRLGVFAYWDSPYLTMSFGYEFTIIKEFFKFIASGQIYKGKRPVHWCPSCITALAEAEVEYNEKVSPSVFVKFKITDETIKISKMFSSVNTDQIYIVIWTTTPWTLPANLALAVNPEIFYVLVESKGEALIVAEDNLNYLREKINLIGDIVFRLKGKDLEGIKARHPWMDRDSIIISGDFVSTNEGSGIVHIAPGHGEDDYKIGLKYNLDIYAPVDDTGKFTKSVPEFEGQFVFKANEGIIELLKQRDALIKIEKITHSYPHCWRCKKPVIFRATSQWFISMDNRDLRRRALEEIQKVQWIPMWGKDRLYQMVLERPDWCISRQRAWGVPIMLIICCDCGSFINAPLLFEKIINLTEKEGADIWFNKEIKEFLPQGYECSKCSSVNFKKEMDILDVWFDSGVSYAAVLENDKRLSIPADIYLEGVDQHRGWFQSSILACVGTRGMAPYRTILTHGFTVDGQGKKMSKSIGNVISPQDIIKNNGAEIIRLWVAAEDYCDDIKLSKEIINRLTDAYKKIRNTARFFLGNISDFDGKDYSSNLLEIDRWAMSRLQRLINKVTSAYQRFDFHEVFHSIYNFCVVDMSSFYLDILKDRLYTFRKDSIQRCAAQWVLYQILIDLTRLLAPVLSFTAEEIWICIPEKLKTINPESIFLSDFPIVKTEFIDHGLEDRWARLIDIRDETNKALEIKRKDKIIGNSLEAKVVFFAKEKERGLLNQYEGFLPTLFLISSVEVNIFDNNADGVYVCEKIEDLYIKVEHSVGKKCERCWNWTASVGTLKECPDICGKCYEAIK